MNDLIHKEESYRIIGICMEVHKQLGRGFDEILYKDALQYEFSAEGIEFERECEFEVKYKSIILPHYFYADFVVFGKIILEVKAVQALTSSHVKQTMNYLAASGFKVGLLVNFGEDSLTYRRVVL
jgi:GxxExxY protein